MHLDPGLSVNIMYENFKEQYPDSSVCYETYRLLFGKKNISFTKLGEEECETCEIYKQHVCSKKSETDEQESSDCETCLRHEEHLVRAKLSRDLYREDKEKNVGPENHYFSMDMEKVIMLPHLPGIKTSLFTRRIIMFNQTIAPLGGKGSGDGKAIGFLWHEATQGRKDEDVASVVIKFLITSPYRDYKDIIIWCDNCSGQNKNWTLFSALVHFLCHPLSCVMSITLRFFEKGHTFMSADAAHHNNENAIRRKRFMYDFQDFVDCVNDKGTAILMQPEDFIDFKNEKGNSKDVHS